MGHPSDFPSAQGGWGFTPGLESLDGGDNIITLQRLNRLVAQQNEKNAEIEHMRIQKFKEAKGRDPDVDEMNDIIDSLPKLPCSSLENSTPALCAGVRSLREN